VSQHRPGARVVTDRTGASYDDAGVRQVRATALGRGTHGVADVRRMLETQFHVAFPHRIWVAGKVGEVKVDGPAPADGESDLRFLLEATIEPDELWLPCLVPGPSASAVGDLLHRSHDAVLGEVVQLGRLVRVGGLLRFDARRNAMVLVVSELDPTPAEMAVVDQREAARRAVTDEGLPARQRTLACRLAPLDVVVVGGDPATDSTLGTLSASGFAVRPRAVPVELTGADAPLVLSAAVRRAAQDADVVLLVRGPGRPLGLAVYDAVEVARAVAAAPVPVVTGLGGGQVRTTCDVVAFAALPTADEAAQWVITRLREAEQHLTGLATEVDELSLAAGIRWRRSLDSVAQEIDASAAQAAVRSEHTRCLARRRLRIGGAVLAVLALAAAVVSGVPALAVFAVVAVLAVAAVELWWRGRGMTTSRRYSMPQGDDEFAQVMQRLHTVREQLDHTDSVERVAALHAAATQLVVRGRELLGSHFGTPAPVPDTEWAEASLAAEAGGVPGEPDVGALQDGAQPR